MAGYDEAEVGDLRGAVANVVDWPDVEERTMFGSPSFTADGERFAVVSNQGVSITKLPEGPRTELETTVPVAPFDAGGGEIQGWAAVPPKSVDLNALEPSLRASYESALAAAGE